MPIRITRERKEKKKRRTKKWFQLLLLHSAALTTLTSEVKYIKFTSIIKRFDLNAGHKNGEKEIQNKTN